LLRASTEEALDSVKGEQSGATVMLGVYWSAAQVLKWKSGLAVCEQRSKIVILSAPNCIGERGRGGV
jgi:hypothetical protein